MGWNRAPYTKDELITLMKEKAKELGHTPRMNEFQQSGTAIKYFGSWANFQLEAGLKITYLRSTIDRREYIIKELQKLAQELERSPHFNEYGRYDLAKRLFGSWNNALLAAGLKINKK